MQAGNSKHAAWRDENLAHDIRALTRQGSGTGRAEAWRDAEPTADDDLGVLTGNRWEEPAQASTPSDRT